MVARYLFALLVTALLQACGGGGAVADTVPAPKPVRLDVVRVLFTQSDTPPIIVNDPGDARSFPRDVAFLTTFDIGHLANTNDSRGVGIVNDSWTAPNGSNPIKTANLSWMPSAQIHPWINSDASVCTNFTASVPESIMQGAVPETRAHGTWGNYVGADIWLNGGGKTVIVSGSLFDQERTMDDSGPWPYPELNAVQYRGAIGQSRWFTTTAGTFTSFTFSESRPFGFCITREQATRMFSLAGISVDMATITAQQALLSNETNLGVPSQQDPSAAGALLTSFFSNWVVSLEVAR